MLDLCQSVSAGQGLPSRSKFSSNACFACTSRSLRRGVRAGVFVGVIDDIAATGLRALVDMARGWMVGIVVDIQVAGEQVSRVFCYVTRLMG